MGASADRPLFALLPTATLGEASDDVSQEVDMLVHARPTAAGPRARRAGLRVLLSHADVLSRPGVARLLTDAGLTVVDQVADAADLVGTVLGHRPDVLLLDVRAARAGGRAMLLAAVEVRRRAPETAVLVLADHYEPTLAPQLVGDRPEGVGYLLQDRIGDLDHVLDALDRVAAGGSVLDPAVVARLLGRRVPDDPLSVLTPGQLAVLAAMAEGGSNRGIARGMHVSEASVEKHVTAVFRALGLLPAPDVHRRVRAVLVYLQATGRR